MSFENRVVNRIAMKDAMRFTREQRKQAEAYVNYKSQLSDEEFIEEWNKACNRVKEGLVRCQLKD